MQTQADSANVPMANLYAGWMTGYSYQACKNRYFSTDLLSELTSEKRHSLLVWLHTYLDLVVALKPSGVPNLATHLQTMITEVADQTTGKGSVQLRDFDTWYSGVEGVLRANLPSAYHAAGFAAAVSDLGYGHPVGDTLHLLKHDLYHWLLELKSIISREAFEVVDKDRQRLIGRLKKVSSTEVPKDFLAGVMLIQDQWGGMILDQRSARDLLGDRGRSTLWALAALAGIGIGLAVGGLVAIPFYVIVKLTGIDVSHISLSDPGSLFSTLQTLLGSLAAAGVSLAFLARKGSEGFGAVVSYLSIYLAGRRSLKLKDADFTSNRDEPSHAKSTARPLSGEP